MTLNEAIEYLRSTGENVEAAPKRWQKAGFTYFAPVASQYLTDAQLIEYAGNTADLNA